MYTYLSFCGTGIWEWLSWVVLVQGFSLRLHQLLAEAAFISKLN